MENLWSDEEVKATVLAHAEKGIGAELALLVYATRLIGGDPSLVLHGGGNSSLKTPAKDIFGEAVEALFVKGSGHDMATIEAPGFACVRLAELRRLAALETLSDREMDNARRCFLLDNNAPAPSVEFLLHAFLPHKFCLHSHADAVLALTNQPDEGELARKVFGKRAAIVPYMKPGFGLAKAALRAFEADPSVEALVLVKHGVFTFSDDAKEAYGRMVEMVSLAEEHLADKGRKPVFSAAALPGAPAPLAEVAPLLRGLCRLEEDGADGSKRPLILDFRSTDAILDYVNGAELARYAGAGAVTPDHTIRTRSWPLLAPFAEAGKLEAFQAALKTALERYAEESFDSLKRNHFFGGALDGVPRVVLVPGLGLFGLGESARDAAIAADMAENTVAVVTAAESVGTFESAPEADLLEVELWPLERAKLGDGTGKTLAGRVCAVTGGAGAIGAAVAKAFAGEGCEVALLDLDGEAASAAAAGISAHALGIACDVTDEASVRAAFDRVCETYGGVDIAVSNAGAAWQGTIGEIDDKLLRKSFDLNFFGHQTVAQNAVRVMRAQGGGGCLLFNVSKQAVNPGKDFGAYGLPKAAAMFLVRQYALDHAKDGLRTGGVNADRIRSGLLSNEMIAARSKARGLSEADYMGGNLLGREVTAEDVAQAFVYLAKARASTADILTVDGGNIAAALR